MKRVLLILTLAIGCSLLASCEKETILTVNQSSMSFNNGGGSQTVNLVANKVWTASSNQSWCKVSPSSGDGSDNSNITLSVSCDTNATYDERTCTITITCEELTKTISVSQAEGKGLIISQTEYNLTNDAQTISVEVQSNVNYSVEIDNACKSWIKQDATKGLSSNIIKFAISKNEDFDGREGKITIKQTDGSLSGTVVVKQSQQNGLFISTPEYSLSNEKHTLTVEVKANVEFDVKSNVDWIKHVETKGLKTSQIVLEVAANEDYDGREGTVVVKQKGGDLEGVITIKQEQNYGLFLSQSEFSVSNEAQTIDVEVKYNVDFDVVIPDSCKDWISIVGTKGLSSRNYTIAIAKNETYDNREGSITFKQKNGSLSGTVIFLQSQTDALFAEQKEYVVSAEEQQLSIKILSNVSGYTLTIDGSYRDWLKIIPTKGLDESVILFQVAKNEGEEREAVLLLRSEHIQNEITIIQKAEEGYVEFDDAVFKAYCIENFDKNGDGELSIPEANVITRIDVSTTSITSMKGIESMRHLQYLFCRGDGKDNLGLLTSLDVSKNTSLKGLYCGNNRLTGLDVSNNTALRYLDCYINQLTSIDVSNNLELESLQCFMNDISSLDLGNNTELTYISCGNNEITSLNIRNCSKLLMLSCEMNQLRSLGISNCSSLTSLSCSHNQLTSLDVNNNTSLTDLYCSFNQLSSLDVSNNTALETLVCSDNQITSLDISNNTVLTGLTCHNNLITNLDIGNNALLTALSCYNNRLKSIDLRKVSKLITLSCFDNQLTSLDVSNNTALSILRCHNNQLSSLDVSNNNALTEMWCHDNRLTSLVVGDNSELTTLLCYNNQLTSLDVSNNTALSMLRCQDNQLTSLNVSNNTALTELWCNNNQLTSLDVIDNSALTDLECHNNLLSRLDVSSNIALTGLMCDNNQLTNLDVSHNSALLHLYCRNNLITSLDVSYNLELKLLWCHNNPELKDIWLKAGQVINYFRYDTDVATIKYK